MGSCGWLLRGLLFEFWRTEAGCRKVIYFIAENAEVRIVFFILPSVLNDTNAKGIVSLSTVPISSILILAIT